MNIYIWLWLGAIVVFGVAELLTEGMVSIWFLAGSLAALVTCMSGLSLGSISPEGTQVKIQKIEGVKLLVQFSEKVEVVK